MRIKGKKIMRGAVKRSSSTRVLPGSEEAAERESLNGSNALDVSDSKSPDPDAKSEQLSMTSSSSSSTPPNAAAAFFDAVSLPRWRTVSDPLRDRKKSRRSSKYIHLSSLFHSTGTVDRSVSQSNLSSVNHHPEHDSAASDGSMNVTVPKHFVFGAGSLSNSNDALSESSPNHKGQLASLAEDSKSITDEEARIRMDSGVVLDKPSERPRYRRVPSVPQGTDWEGSGVAGVKISRKLAVRKNRKSRSSMSYLPERSIRRKVLKIMFVGNDKTVSNLARAYYELRRRQMTRAPLLNHVDLRMFYVPVGETPFEDERIDYPAEPTSFDLQIGEMLGSVDPWYQSSVTMTFNNLLRVCPKNIDGDVEHDGKAKEDPKSRSIVTPEKIIANSLAEYSRFAVTTYNVPLFKANMRSSTNESITVVFCTGVEIGSVAYKQAIKQGRFGKLVDLSNDSGPPEAFTSFEYAKFGINGTFKSSTRIDAKFYRSVSIVPVALTNDNKKEQMLYAGADSMHVTMVENEKYVKSIKKLKRGQSEEEGVESVGSKLYISAAKMEVERPTQGTFAVWIDQTLMYTNIKSIEVSRCVAPEYERSHAPKRKHARGPPKFVSLPLKTFWPLNNPSA
uniref:Uncharacterized protein LOC100183938 n=1 Tax=Phallusia mammillata TaxID=59560 RepID=A0A6F9DIP9_9ASCI|nr:uncharacterized protein LOC100183938 [Phallusia mammillata]